MMPCIRDKIIGVKRQELLYDSSFQNLYQLLGGIDGIFFMYYIYF